MSPRHAHRKLLALVLCLGATASCGADTEGEGGQPRGPGFEQSQEAYRRGRNRAREGRHDLALGEFRQAMDLDAGDVQLHLAAAASLFALERYGEAQGLLATAATQFPDDARVALQLGLAHLKMARLDLAAREFERASSLDPLQSEAHYWRGRALYERSILLMGTTQINQAKLDEAIEAFEAAVAADPSRAEYRYRAGLALDRKRRPQEAIAMLREAVKRAPGHADSLRTLGALLLEEGDVEAAADALQEAVRLAGGDPKNHYELGLALEEGGDRQAALEAFDAAIAARASYPSPHFRRAMLLRRLARDEEADASQAAFEHWEQVERDVNSKRLAAMAQPNDPLKQHEFGVALFKAMRWNEARVPFQRALALNPSMQATHGALGWLQWKDGDLAGSKLSYETALKLEPGNAALMLELVAVLRGLRDAEGARDLLEELIVITPEDPGPHLELADVCLAQGETARALEEYQAVLDLDADNVRALFNLGSLHFVSDEFAEAAERWEQVLALEPDHPRAGRFLAEVQAELAAVQADE